MGTLGDQSMWTDTGFNLVVLYMLDTWKDDSAVQVACIQT